MVILVIKGLVSPYDPKPGTSMKIFSKLNLLNNKEKENLNHWIKPKIYNHAKKEVGEIVTKML